MYYFKKIIEKYNYNKKFGKLLYQIYLELIKYYGNENIVYHAFLDTEIISVPDIYEYLLKNDMLEELQSQTEEDLRRSTGINVSNSNIIEEEGKFKIVSIKRKVLIREFEIYYNYKIAYLIHELCHMVKNYYEEYKINGNILIRNSGLIKTEFKLKNKNGKIRKRLISEHGVGLEEGFTMLAEACIMRNIIDFPLVILTER